jgi:hypothetical protein
MEKLFRFALVRPPVDQVGEKKNIPLAQSTSFQKTLAQAFQETSSPREAVGKVVKDYISGCVIKSTYAQYADSGCIAMTISQSSFPPQTTILMPQS